MSNEQPDKVYVVIAELRSSSDTATPTFFFTNEDDAYEFCNKQEKICPLVRYFIEPVRNGKLIEE